MMMTPPPPAPTIGITTYCRNEADQFYLPAVYVEAVRAAGGSPILLPPGAGDPVALLHLVDGLILAGGGDLDPTRYDGASHPQVYMVDPERDAFELALAKNGFQTNTPVLGICRGLQVLIVASGGELYLHLPDEFGDAVVHRKAPRVAADHDVEVEPDSRLAQLLGATRVCVPSSHHQAVRSVPPGWRVVARAADGVIEALEFLSHPWMVAVQWHPELSKAKPHQRLFEGLVQAAENAPRT